jgi:hypothetical protein
MSIKRYIFFQSRRTDDVRAPFPVSDHVLHLNSRPPRIMSAKAPTALLPIMPAALMTLLCIVSVSLARGPASGTVSFFSDFERSQGNIFITDPIDFSVTAASATTTLSNNTDATVVLTMTPASSSDPIKYAISAYPSSGDGALCAGLSVYTSAPFAYTGTLGSLSGATTTQIGPWTLNVAHGSWPQAGGTCDMTLVYTADNADSFPGQGYHVTQKVTLTFIAPPLPAAAVEAPAEVPAPVPEPGAQEMLPTTEVMNPAPADGTPPAPDTPAESNPAPVTPSEGGAAIQDASPTDSS